jgi:hypothetical protein
MLNGAGMLHGGCVAYLIDKWVSEVFFLASNDDDFFKVAVVPHLSSSAFLKT